MSAVIGESFVSWWSPAELMLCGELTVVNDMAVVSQLLCPVSACGT